MQSLPSKVLLAALGGSTDGIVIADQNKVIVFVNPVWERMTGRSSDMLKGKKMDFVKNERIVIDKWYVRVQPDSKERERLDRLKDDFMNVAAHDLRTPITAIKGFVQMVRAGDSSPPKAKPSFELIKNPLIPFNHLHNV